MKKYIFPAIVSAFLIANTASAEEQQKNSVRGILVQTGIGLKESAPVAPQTQETPQVSDPVKWKDETKLSKQPQKPQPQQQTQPQTQPQTEKTATDTKCYYVTSQVTNIRSTPSFLAERTGIYKKGSYICEENRIGEWIDTGKGWVNTKFLSAKMPSDIAKTEPAAPAAEAETKTRMTEYNYDNPVQTQKPVINNQKTIETVKPAKTEPIYKYVIGGKVNIRSLASLNSDVVGQYQKNEKIEIIEAKTGWVRTKQGWVNSDYVSDKSSEEKTAAPEKQKIIKTLYVSYKKANIRREPTKNSKLLGNYERGDKVDIYEIKGEWARSEKGWVNLTNLKNVKCFTVASKTLKARSKPDANAKVLITYQKGNKVCEYNRKYGWVDTGKGWVAAEYLER